MTKFETAVAISMTFTALAGCSYGDERTYVEIENALAMPSSHVFAAAVDYSRVQDPTGFLNTFPNGGMLRVLERKARVYVIDVDSETITLAAEIDDFADIPQPKQVRIEGWRDSTVYFSLFGYGGDARSGDDLSDERRLTYRINVGGDLQRMDDLPNDLASAQNSGPPGEKPFLRLSTRHRDINIGIDSSPNQSENAARFWLDDETGEPQLFVVN